MTDLKVNVYKNRQIIVPIRFVRACTGNCQREKPDFDDRGFAMGKRPAKWSTTDTRGPMLAILKGDRATLKILREDISSDAPLYILSDKPDAIEVTSPPNGTMLSGDDLFEIHALDNPADGPIKIQVHLGAPNGPILSEMEPHIFTLKKVHVLVHLVKIDGVDTTRTANSLVDHFRMVNDVWRPCGIHFVYRKTETVSETIVGSRFLERDGTMQPLPAPLGPGGHFAAAGTVTTNLNPPAGIPWECNEFSTLLQIHPAPDVLNLYCVHAAPEWLGLTYDNDIPRPNGYGVVISDAASPYIATAHELGHFLNLDVHADENNSGQSFRQDIWTLRRLMVGVWPINCNPAYRHNVGYKGNDSGMMITVKNFGATQDPNDGECQKARIRANNPY